MEFGRHVYTGVYSTGNPNQPEGRHSAYHMDKGIGLIPMGNRSRVVEYGEGVLEERDSLDKYSKYANRN